MSSNLNLRITDLFRLCACGAGEMARCAHKLAQQLGRLPRPSSKHARDEGLAGWPRRGSGHFRHRGLLVDEATRQQWKQRMPQIPPDVKPGAPLLGLDRNDRPTRYRNRRPIGELHSPGFAIWLDIPASAAELGATLLKRPGG